MKSGTLLKIFGVCAVSFLSLAGGSAQAGDSCILSSLSHPVASVDGANAAGNSREANRASASDQNQDVVATLAPLVGSMAKEGIHTATSVMRALTHEASQVLQE